MIEPDQVEIKSQRFLREAETHFLPLNGSYIHSAVMRDLREKTLQTGRGYVEWLHKLFSYIAASSGSPVETVLDVGCGIGETTVLIKKLGLDAYGIDLHKPHLDLARILARENGISEDMFIEGHGGQLPFPSNHFDVVTLFVVMEHLDDDIAKNLLREIRRVCRGTLFILVPNKLQKRDDHTGLAGVPWMPHWFAKRYVSLFGQQRRYHISDSGEFDVHYRFLGKIGSLLNDAGFSWEHVPDDCVYPPLETVPAIDEIGVSRQLFGRFRFFGFRLTPKLLQATGRAKQWTYPYLNIVAH